jgi:hypothetical protein
MTVVRSVAVQNMHGTSIAPFWPGGGKELNVEFGADSDGTCSVRGIDPDNNKVVFSGMIRTAQQDRFIEAVRAGRPSTAQLGSDQGRTRYLVPLTSIASKVAYNGNLLFTANAPGSQAVAPEAPASFADPRGAGPSGLSSDIALSAVLLDDNAVVISGGDPHPP